MKKDILTFALKPGDPVSAHKIADRYEVSRTPAREALVRLQDEGLVDIYPQSGSVISKIRGELIRQEWFVRKSLELSMVDSFFEKVRPSDIEEMRASIRQMAKLGDMPRTHESSYEYLRSDDCFHEITYRVAGEKLAAEIMARNLLNYRRVRLLADLDNDNKDRTVDDHWRLVGYVEENKREEYRNFLDKHLSHIEGDMQNIRKNFPEMFER